MPYDEGLAERLREAYQDIANVSERKMFGGLAFMVNGNMSCGVSGDSLMARVGPERYADALAKPHAREMDVTGRALTGFVFVAPEGLDSDTDLRSWVALSLEFVTTLPPK